MPELPEVESIRRTLAAHLPGRRVVGVDLRRRDVCTAHDGRACRRRDLLLGATIERLDRRGKQLAIIADDGRALCIHLGMSGRLSCAQPGQRPDRHTHVRWRLDSGMVMSFRDPRRFGGVWTFPSAAMLQAARWSDLGPDALEADAPSLIAALARTARAVKAVLLDQRILAGVGNIYADEALFSAGINPRRRGDRLRAEEIEGLAAAIRTTLQRAIDAGGSTIRDYVDGNGNSGGYQRARLVYDRAGEPCPRCGRRLRGARVAQRATVYCAGCQPPRGSGSRGAYPQLRRDLPASFEFSGRWWCGSLPLGKKSFQSSPKYAPSDCGRSGPSPIRR